MVLTYEQLLSTSSCWIVLVDNGRKQGLSHYTGPYRIWRARKMY